MRELKRDAVFGQDTLLRHTGSRQISVEDHVRPGIMSKKAVPFRFTDPAADALTRCPVAYPNRPPKFLGLSGGIRVALSEREGGREPVSPICSQCFSTCAIEYTISRDHRCTGAGETSCKLANWVF